MNIIQICGIAICLWELLKILVDKICQQGQNVPSDVSHQVQTKPISKPTVATKEEFVNYLKSWWADKEFTVSDVCPNNWTNQRTAAIIRLLYSQGWLTREIKENKCLYKFTH